MNTKFSFTNGQLIVNVVSLLLVLQSTLVFAAPQNRFQQQPPTEFKIRVPQTNPTPTPTQTPKAKPTPSSTPQNTAVTRVRPTPTPVPADNPVQATEPVRTTTKPAKLAPAARNLSFSKTSIPQARNKRTEILSDSEASEVINITDEALAEFTPEEFEEYLDKLRLLSDYHFRQGRNKIYESGERAGTLKPARTTGAWVRVFAYFMSGRKFMGFIPSFRTKAILDDPSFGMQRWETMSVSMLGGDPQLTPANHPVKFNKTTGEILSIETYFTEAMKIAQLDIRQTTKRLFGQQGAGKGKFSISWTDPKYHFLVHIPTGTPVAILECGNVFQSFDITPWRPEVKTTPGERIDNTCHPKSEEELTDDDIEESTSPDGKLYIKTTNFGCGKVEKYVKETITIKDTTCQVGERRFVPLFVTGGTDATTTVRVDQNGNPIASATNDKQKPLKPGRMRVEDMAKRVEKSKKKNEVETFGYSNDTVLEAFDAIKASGYKTKTKFNVAFVLKDNCTGEYLVALYDRDSYLKWFLIGYAAGFGTGFFVKGLLNPKEAAQLFKPNVPTPTTTPGTLVGGKPTIF